MNDPAIRAEIQELAVQHEAAPEPSLAYRPFPVDLLPEPIRGYIQASAAAIGCDPAFVALPMLAALASAIGSRRRILLKNRWTEPTIIWALTIATSGSHKSPGFDSAMLPVRKRQEKARQHRHVEARRRYAFAVTQHEAEHKKWKDAGGQGEEPREPQDPILERCWTDNTTMEALAALLAQNPRGLLLACDELSAWFGSFDRYSKNKANADAARWMHLHGGRSFVIDRKTGIPPTIFVEHGTVSVAGSIQPGVLRRTLTAEHQESGLAARFLFAMPPKKQKRWTEAEIDDKLEAEVMALFDRLYDLQPDHDDDGDPIAHVVKLSSAAKHDVWIPFYNAHGKEQVALDDGLSAAWSKLEGYATRLALVHHLVRVAADDATVSDPDIVDETSMAAGITLSRWFGQEAKRVYAMLAEDEGEQTIRELVELVERLGGKVTPRDLLRHTRKYRQAHVAENALQLLVNDHRGAWQTVPPSPKGGMAKRVFVLHRVDTTRAKHSDNGVSVNVNGEAQGDE